MKFIDFSEREKRYVRETDLEKNYVSEMKKKVKEDKNYYPTYHISPPHGLLNDPNGLFQDDEGFYHIFYQWFPFGTVHGLKHWHHLKTKDFVHYVDYGAKMIPEKPYDYFGCYTGMALKEKELVHIFYTGIVDKKGDILIPATIHAQMKNNKIIKTAIIEEVDLKKTTHNFRDPFVFKKDSLYYMLTGAENLKHQGVLKVSCSNNPKKTFIPMGDLNLKNEDFGYMIECPNYFETDNKGILIFSPQGIKSPNKYDFRNVFSVVYAVGQKIDFDHLTFDYQSYFELDKGFDFYAPQIFKDQNGRTILYGWLGNSKTAYPSDEFQWSHMLTIPREIAIVGNRISQKPIEELSNLRISEEKYLTLKEQCQKSIELSFLTKIGKIKIQNENAEYIEFSINESDYSLDREHSSQLYNHEYGQVRYANRLNENEHVCQIYIDHSSIEIFVDDGMTVFTSRFFLDGDWTITSENISFNYFELKKNEIDFNC